MKHIDLSTLTKDIHFPITRAIYKKPPKRNWLQKIQKFVVYKRHYELMEDYCLYIPFLDKWLFIPAPFFYDNASVPKVLSGLYNADGMLLLGALPHDFGYRYECIIFIDNKNGGLIIHPYSKSELDSLFRYLCSYESGFTKSSAVAKFGLSIGGFVGWQSNRKKNHNLQKDFPDIYEDETDESIEEF